MIEYGEDEDLDLWAFDGEDDEIAALFGDLDDPEVKVQTRSDLIDKLYCHLAYLEEHLDDEGYDAYRKLVSCLAELETELAE